MAGARRGFTLLEAVVALGLAVLVLTTLYGVVTRTAAAHRHAVGETDGRMAARVLLVAIAHEIEAALATEETTGPLRFSVAPAPPGAPPWSALRLATLDGDDDVRLVAYRVEPRVGSEGGGVLVRRTVPRLAPPASSEPPGAPVLAHVRVFRVRCFDGVEWAGSWTRPGLPRAVEVTLADTDDDELTMTVTPAAPGRS